MTVMSMGAILRYYADRKPADAPAITFPDATLTWDQIDRQTNRLARLYRSVGVRKGDKIAIALGNGIPFHLAAFAAWKLGASPSGLSPKLSHLEFTELVDLMRPSLLLTASGRAEGLSIPVLGADPDLSGFDDAGFEFEIASYWKTSSSGGSTGRPKIIVHDAPGAVDPETQGYWTEFRLRPDSVILNPGPLYHNAPFIFSHYALFTGGSVIGMERFDPEEALQLIERHRVNWVFLVPTMMHRIWSLPAEVRERYDLSSLETVWHMASICPAWLKEAWIGWLGADRIWERYGGTEGFGSTVISGPEWLSHRGSVGKVTSKAKLKIVGENGETLGPGEVGELFFLPTGDRPPSFYIGAEARRDPEGYLSLGDLGYRDDDGYVFLADRRTDLIIRGGANIYPAELEAALDEHPTVGSSIVIGLPCADLGARVHAIVQPAEGETLDLADVHAFLKQRLVPYKLPESYELSDAPLRDDAGKARRNALRDERSMWATEGRCFRIFTSDLPDAGRSTARGVAA